MSIALVALSSEGAEIVTCIRMKMNEGDCYFHTSVPSHWNGERFERIIELTQRIFSRYKTIVYVASCGIVVRALQGLVQHKTTDPAVVVIDAGGRYVISLLSGHEGGANAMAYHLGNLIHAEPVITTSSEALKTLIVGIGCRRGTASEAIIQAIDTALNLVNRMRQDIRMLASADLKVHEKGLHEAASILDVPLRFISSQEILLTNRTLKKSQFTLRKVGLPGVAEPSALLAGRRTQLLLPKTIYPGITIAIARECCMWSDSDQVEKKIEPKEPKKQSRTATE